MFLDDYMLDPVNDMEMEKLYFLRVVGLFFLEIRRLRLFVKLVQIQELSLAVELVEIRAWTLVLILTSRVSNRPLRWLLNHH